MIRGKIRGTGTIQRNIPRKKTGPTRVQLDIGHNEVQSSDDNRIQHEVEHRRLKVFLEALFGYRIANLLIRR